MEIIPAIDIIGGKCVRLTKGNYDSKKVYANDPLLMAKRFEDNGIKRLHLVDLDGAKANHIVNLNVLESIASGTNLTIDFGGGIKSDKDIEDAFNAGADMVTGGSIAVKDETLFGRWLGKYGNEKIILGADVKDNYIAVSGWMETSKQEIFEFLSGYIAKSIKYVICTDIAKDGVLLGPSIDLYEQILNEFPGLYLIASGGVTTVGDLHRLEEIGSWGAIIGKAIYEGNIAIEELKPFIK